MDLTGPSTAAVIYNTSHSDWDSWQVGSGAYGVTGFNIVDTTAGASRLTITNSGNVGIGTTSPLLPLQIGSSGGLFSPSGGTIDLVSNLYPGPGWTYLANNYASVLEQYQGNLTFYIAPSGQSGAGATVTSAFTVRNSGNVGIGTTAPGTALEVNGTVKIDTTGTNGLTFSGAPGTQTTPWTGVLCGGDYAEAVNAKGSRKTYEPGDVLVIGDDAEGEVRKSAEPYSTMVAGIFATKPGVIGRRQSLLKDAEEIPMAMIGIVPTKVTTENGPIRRGDLLVTSSTSGYAMKGTNRRRLVGAVIGKAMGSLDTGTGVIEVLVTLQ
jgi:hypothetical protein